VHPISRFVVVALVSALGAGGAIASADHGGGGGGPGKGGGKAATKVFALDPSTHGNPEGVAWDGRTRAFYVGATGDGTIYRGTLDQDKVTEFIPGATGRAAVGMKVRHGKLYVAGGPTGKIFVYDIATKALDATFDTGAGGFLNDLVVTGHGDVFVTDSFRPTLWHVTRAQVAQHSGTPEAISVAPEVTYQQGFNLNGIVAQGHRTFVVVQTNTGALFRIKLGETTGRTIAKIDAPALAGGDGMLTDRGRLVVVQGSPAQLSFVKLRHGGLRGTIAGTRTDPTLRGPSTVARARNRYLVVNADFTNNTKPFTVSGLSRKGGS
jgi:sugar lactone lactonase YvrE